MKKLISIFVAVAMLASLTVIAITSVSAGTEPTVRWTLPVDDITQWRATKLDGEGQSWEHDAINNQNGVKTCLKGEVVDGAMVLTASEDNNRNYAFAIVNNAGGLVWFNEDDVLNLKFSYDVGTDPTSWTHALEIQLGFVAGTVKLNSLIAPDNLSGSGNILSGTYDFSKPIGEIVQEAAPALYESIFGEGGNTALTYVKFIMSYNEANYTDPTEKLTINSMTVTEAVEESSSSEVSSQPETPSTDAKYDLIADATTNAAVEWRDFGSAVAVSTTYDKLDAFTAFDASFTDSSITYNNFTGTDSALFGWKGTFFTVEEGDVLNLNLKYDTPENAAWSWKVELYNGTDYVNISDAIAASAGLTTTNGFLTTTGQEVVATVDLAEAMGAGTTVGYIRIYLAFAAQSEETTFTINEFAVTKAPEGPKTLYAAGMDSLDNWLTYDKSYTTNNYLAPIGDGSDPAYTGHMKGEVLDDGIKFTFTDEFYGADQADNAYGSFVRQFTAAPGLCTVDNNSYLNLHFKLESETDLYGAQLYVRVGPSGDQDVTSVIADLFDLETVTVTGIGADGVSEVSYDTLPAGEYTISISFKDLLANYSDQLALLEEGAPFIYHQLFVRADDDCAAGDEVALTVYDVSVTTAATYENAYDDLKEDVTSSEAPSSSSEAPSSSETPSSEAPSSSDAGSSSEAPASSSTSTSSGASTATSTASTTGSTSSVAQVQTGEAVLPVVAVAALAVISASAVIISKKRN